MTQPFDQASINYYDENSRAFVADTAEVDMGQLYEPFLSGIPEGGRILDLGCGSGRDTKYFMDKSYEVVAIDASEKMVEATKRLANAVVLQLRFDQINFKNEFDGIWACASLLHVPETALKNVLELCLQALRPTGVIYASFKHGSGQRFERGRFFTDFNEEKLITLVTSLGSASVLSHWITQDVRSDRNNQKWINAIIKINKRT
jgi:SAM-dependent methyltransferase